MFWPTEEIIPENKDAVSGHVPGFRYTRGVRVIPDILICHECGHKVRPDAPYSAGLKTSRDFEIVAESQGPEPNLARYSQGE